MSRGRGVWVGIGFFLLILLHFTVRPILDWRAGVDFLVIALLLVAVRARPGIAALVGFAMGVLADAMAPESFGAGALAMTTVGFAASRLKAAFFADNVALNGIFVFLGKWAFDVVFLLAERRIGGRELVMQLVVWSPLAAAVTAVAGLMVLLVMRPVLGSARG